MDFTRTEAAQDLSGLVGTIVDAVCTPQHQRELDGLEQRFDTQLWGKLIDADILSTAAPESVGGAGFGVLEQTAILAALGRQLAAVPYLESIVLGAGVLGRVGSPELREQFQAEMRELIALAQNHPSVVGWSLGNEYESWTREGIEWTRDMAAFVKGLDPTRPVTFAALGRVLREIRENGVTGEHALDHVDYISLNYYLKPEDLADYVDLVHAQWPEKPVAITEFGLRADRVDNEQARIDHLDVILAQVARRPWICGLSLWSFNDYASRYPGSGQDGYRRWGIVDEFRKPRALYEHAGQRLKRGLPAAFTP